MAGRRGPPLLQLYYDLAKLLSKGAVVGTAVTPVFRLGPAVSLAATAAALALLPLGSLPSAVRFDGDVLLLAGLLALGRYATQLAALDTGSSFEGMGASREAAFGALAEPALLLAFAALARSGGFLSLSALGGAAGPAAWAAAGPVLALAAAALFVLLLAENSRLPVDDPNTHLELTMIHEVMVLDHSGPDFALIQYGAALKLWTFAALVGGILTPIRPDAPGAALAAGTAAVLLVAVAVGLVESVMARLRLPRIPQLLLSAGALALLACGLSLRIST